MYCPSNYRKGDEFDPRSPYYEEGVCWGKEDALEEIRAYLEDGVSDEEVEEVFNRTATWGEYTDLIYLDMDLIY